MKRNKLQSHFKSWEVNTQRNMEIILLQQLRNCLFLLVSFSHALEGKHFFSLFPFIFLGRNYFCLDIKSWLLNLFQSLSVQRKVFSRALFHQPQARHVFVSEYHKYWYRSCWRQHRVCVRLFRNSFMLFLQPWSSPRYQQKALWTASIRIVQQQG